MGCGSSQQAVEVKKQTYDTEEDLRLARARNARSGSFDRILLKVILLGDSGYTN